MKTVGWRCEPARFGLAGTVIESKVKFRNLNWELDETSLALTLGIAQHVVAVANDPAPDVAGLKEVKNGHPLRNPRPFSAREERMGKRFAHRHQRASTPRLHRQTTNSSRPGTSAVNPGGLLWYVTATPVFGVRPRLQGH